MTWQTEQHLCRGTRILTTNWYYWLLRNTRWHAIVLFSFLVDERFGRWQPSRRRTGKLIMEHAMFFFTICFCFFALFIIWIHIIHVIPSIRAIPCDVIVASIFLVPSTVSPPNGVRRSLSCLLFPLTTMVFRRSYYNPFLVLLATFTRHDDEIACVNSSLVPVPISIRVHLVVAWVR